MKKLILVISLALTGCSTVPFGYRYSMTQRSVGGNLMGPYMPIRAVSPTEIIATCTDGGVLKEQTLVLRGVAPSPDSQFNKEVTSWLHRKLAYFEDEGIYLLRDTCTTMKDGRLRGVVLYRLQGSVYHDISSGSVITSVSLYGVLQCDALELGKLLHEKEGGGFSWDRDFARFQRDAQKESLGFWARSPEYHASDKGQAQITDDHQTPR